MINLVQVSIPLLFFFSLVPLESFAQTSEIVGSYYLPAMPGTQQLEGLFTYKSDGTLEISTILSHQRDMTVNTYEVTGKTLRLGKPKAVAICPRSPKADQPNEPQEVLFKKVGDTLVIDMDGFKFQFEAATPEQIARFESIPLCQ